MNLKIFKFVKTLLKIFPNSGKLFKVFQLFPVYLIFTDFSQCIKLATVEPNCGYVCVLYSHVSLHVRMLDITQTP